MATMVVCVNAVGGAASAVATTRDERCVLYSSAIHYDHKYVQVSNGESVAFAQLRGAAETSLSFGLSEALQLPSDGEAQQVTLQVQSAAGDEVVTGGSKPKCKCKCGVAASVRVDFLDRTRPPSAVARGLQRIAAKLLDGAVVWNDRRSSVSWLNRRDGVKFSEVEWESTGSGCCKQLATISSSSRVELHFVGDEQPKGALNAVVFGQVDEYAEQIARELGGVEKYARSLLQTILQRLGPEQEGMETVKPSVGALVSGLPGIGKTALSQAICKCIGVKTIFLNAADIFQTYIESIAPLRGFDTSTEQTFDRMLSMLLVEMDGFNTSQTKLQQSLASDEARMEFLKQHVVILASTTNKELLDPAILRPGRFDVHIHVDFPDEEARREIILQALEKVPVDYSGEPGLDSCETLARLMAKRTTGLSAGDVSAILREAAMASMRDDLQATTVSIKYVLQALEEATGVQMDLELRFAAVKRGERRQMPDALAREETNAAVFTQVGGEGS
ncbi:hypothetical protein PF001_g7055 [Phytophthora fragariae]|uniref:AAA+ ATPase domain-containing protein n=1 Tax=Phytophthora fragariae TaxID=53985 RepID=A0A6A4E393_9STRA|nr:hypothetical protein PF001_g7055 [Phytophthora fragariae]